ncbi:MAG: sodium:calcium antiporter [Chloroflexota bacterium]
MDIVLLVVAFLVILLGAELFTNGIEWFGHKLGLAEGAVGSVLAAVGTALPETMIPLIAILFGGGHSDEIGIGAILGAPFMLATLAMFVTGVAVLASRRSRSTGSAMEVSGSVLVHDMRFFVIAYALAIVVAFLPADLAWPRFVVAGLLLVIYGAYVREHFLAEAGGGDPELAPLRFNRLDPGSPNHPEPPRLRIVTLQVAVALGCIIGGAYLFVGAVTELSLSLGIDEALLALIIAPIATELPEKFNSVIWVRQGKDTLAMGNITGAMVFQSAIPTSVALLFASSGWAITSGSMLAFASAGMAFLATAAVFLPLARGRRLTGRSLLVGGPLYAIYVGLVIAQLSGALG